ncbi:MAG: hypothetical protein WC784_04390 [Candidatus Shapirobacteria bacterium]|jgi:hypothetical protein
MAKEPEKIQAKVIGRVGLVTIATVDIFEGRNTRRCIANGPEDSRCLCKNNNLPEGFHMIDSSMCIKRPGAPCWAVFAKPEENPDLFAYQPELLARCIENKKQQDEEEKK